MDLFEMVAVLNNTNASNITIRITKNRIKLASLLYKEGYIHEYVINYASNQLHIKFKYYEGNKVYKGMKIYRKVGNYRTYTYIQLKKLFNKKKKVFLLSTKIGIITSHQALVHNVGGQIIGLFKTQ